MASSAVTTRDLARDPAQVASELLAWDRGERDVAVRETLDASARDLHRRAYTLWVWIGTSAAGAAQWALPITSRTAIDFHPAGPAAALARCLAAAVDAGAVPNGVTIGDWDGLVYLEAPGLDLELSDLSLADHHPEGTRIRVAWLPEGVRPAGSPLTFAPLPPGADTQGLRALATATGAHPVRVALTLAEHGQPVDEPPETLVRLLREWGLDGEPVATRDEAPSLDIDDDPCPRRRQARRVLQRLLRMGKVGAGYHTEFDHLYRGVAADERAEALAVGKALVRAGLLGEKPSVGQHHVYLRREALPEIHALIERGQTLSPQLVEEWTSPPPGEA